ncbi:polysaccharide deacetylase family sporulation protein PdaB [Mangrovibacillus cuniculi]|uniref:Polysaccharide deacetylase family sporulation protein PdaB n=1 Tax=Mangrovibacillus cuniculi TaxID=2593652 RepID=A0A7S8CE07_9BACI|nr:polysaccharide deacetylase family sporulation protein PdaB [Mangrovibacillus cuniculi]QPC48073.1 polysaccharide deacetylase family sporulation protein PdaB [Mangrovibacillus cuniculi]
MNSFFVINGSKMKRGLLVVLVAFFTALFVYTQTVSTTTVFKTDNGTRAVYSGKDGIALTFNIGWGDKQAVPIIEQLVSENVKQATFFLSGSWAERHPDTVELIKKSGFEIGSLGYAYVDYTDLPDDKIKRDILKSQEVFTKLNVKDVKLLRTPTGHFNEKVISISDKLGFSLIHWSITTDDWKNPGVDKIVENASKTKKGDIVLLHASDAAKQTSKALPEILNKLKNKGEFVTVSTLLSNGNIKTKLVP